MTEIDALRAAFSRLSSSAHTQIGLRALRDAQALGGRNPAESERLIAKARASLPYAKAEAERREARIVANYVAEGLGEW